jgi:hypothetical protein
VTSSKTEEVTDAAPPWVVVPCVTVVSDTVLWEVCVVGADVVDPVLWEGVEVGSDTSSVEAVSTAREQRDTRHSAPISRATRAVFILSTRVRCDVCWRVNFPCVCDPCTGYTNPNRSGYDV